MITLAEIDAVAKRFKVPGETIEKDYVISWILVSLSKSALKNDFAFYGGTAIKRIYFFDDHRFSEDIDLISVKTFWSEELVREVTKAFQAAKEQANLEMSIDPNRILRNGTRAQMWVRYSGYEEIMGAPKEIRLDFAMDMGLYGKTKEEKIIESYSDLKKRNATFPVQTLNTILANKLGLLMDGSRKEPRDLFDIWFLLARMDQFDFNLEQVCDAFKQKYGYFPSFSVLKPHLGNRLYPERWNTRLKTQIADLPEIERVLKEIKNKLEKLLPQQD